MAAKTKAELKKAKADKNDELKKSLGTGLDAYREYEKKAKQYVPTTLNTRGDRTYIQTGSLVVDVLTGRKGIPEGCVTEIAGEPGGGKTTLALKICANVIKNGGTAAYVNAEKVLDENYALTLGLDIKNESNFEYLEVSNYEGVARKLTTLITVAKVNVIVIDSVSSLMSEANQKDDASMGDTKIGAAASFWSKFLPKLCSLANEHNVSIVAINQFRTANIGSPTGPTQETTGGKALKYFKSLAIHLRPGIRKETTINEFGDEEKQMDRNEVKVFIEKNKFGVPGKQAMTIIRFGQGFDNYDALIRMAKAKGLIRLSGAFWSYGEEGSANYFKIQGQDNATTHIRNSKELVGELASRVGIENAQTYFPELAD